MTISDLFDASVGPNSSRIYIERADVDDRLEHAIETKRHVVIFGAPGVGKTTLIKSRLDPTRLLHVGCLRGQQAPDVYRSVLAEAGARVRTETKLTRRRRLGASLKLLSGDRETGSERTENEVTIDLGNVGDVFRTLRTQSVKEFIVLNDFHLLARTAQRILIRNLQYILEQTSTKLIIVGNWTNPAYLTDLSEILPNFICEVPIRPWSNDDSCMFLSQVEKRLNVSFDDQLRAYLIQTAAGSVRDLNELCRTLLHEVGPRSHPQAIKRVPSTQDLQSVLQQRTSRLIKRYRETLSAYLTTELYSIEGVDLAQLFFRRLRDSVLSYSYDELERALREAIDEKNLPRQLKRQRRTRLVDLLCRAASRDSSDVSVSFDDFLTATPPDELPVDRTQFKRLSEALIKVQIELHPRPLLYDPRAVSLVAVEPAFRSFLTTINGQVSDLERINSAHIDDKHYWAWDSKWEKRIRRQAKLNRWRNSHPLDTRPT